MVYIFSHVMKWRILFTRNIEMLHVSVRPQKQLGVIEELYFPVMEKTWVGLATELARLLTCYWGLMEPATGRLWGGGEERVRGSWSSNVDFYLGQSSKARGAGDPGQSWERKQPLCGGITCTAGIRGEFLGSNKDLHCLSRPLLLQLCFLSIHDTFKRIDIHVIPQDLLGSCHMLTNHLFATVKDLFIQDD